MAAGSLVNAVCYESAQLATDAYFSGLSAPVVVDPVTGVSSQVNFVFLSGVWHQQKYSTSPFGVRVLDYSVVVSPPVFPSCYADSESFSDGLSIGWALSAVMVSVFLVAVVRRSFNA